MNSLLSLNVPSPLFSSHLCRDCPVSPHPSACRAASCGSGSSSSVSPATAVSGLSAPSTGSQGNKQNYHVTFDNAIPSRMPIPARDSVIKFGKYNGRMLGTLPFKYLTWMSKNLKYGWPKIVDEVLQDPVYRDRIEWEPVHKILAGDNLRPSVLENPYSAILKIGQRFGWDFDDVEGWSRVKFELIGTSKSGRIPRKRDALSQGSSDEKNKKIGTSENEFNTSSRRKEERPLSFGDILRKASFEANNTKAPGSFFTEAFKSFESERVRGVNKNKVSVLEQGKGMAGKDVKESKGTLRERRQRRRQMQQFHILDGDVIDGEDRKDGVMVTKQNDSSNVSCTFNPFPGRDEILKKLNG